MIVTFTEMLKRYTGVPRCTSLTKDIAYIEGDLHTKYIDLEIVYRVEN